MFDGCDEHTTTIIDTALADARHLGHDYLGTEHLLVALSRRRDLLPNAVAELLPSPDDLISRLVADIGARAQGDDQLLRTLGIDLDEVRSAVRRTFGDSAVDQIGRRRVHQPWQPWRRPFRRCSSLLGGTVSVAARVKHALELARRRADRADGVIRPAGLLLGMIDVEGAMSNRLLRETGVNPADVRRRLAS